MAKKKKTGKKKRSGGSAKDGSASQPKLSQMERFVRFSVQTRSEQIQSWRQQRDNLRRDNQRLEDQIQSLKSTQREVVGKLREKTSGTEVEFSQFERELHKKIEAAVQEKHQFIKEQERAIVMMRRKLRETEQEIVQQNEVLRSLQVFQVAGQQQNLELIADMENTIKEMKEEHNESLDDISRRFEFARERFSANLSARVERTRELATDNAIEIQNSRDKVAAAEREWLKRELDTHKAEKRRLETICDDLEQENLRLFASLYQDYSQGSHSRTLHNRHSSMITEEEEENHEQIDRMEKEIKETNYLPELYEIDGNVNTFPNSDSKDTQGEWHISPRGEPIFVQREPSALQLFREGQVRRVRQLKTFGHVPVPVTPHNESTRNPILPYICASNNPSPRAQAILEETSKILSKTSPLRRMQFHNRSSDKVQAMSLFSTSSKGPKFSAQNLQISRSFPKEADVQKLPAISVSHLNTESRE
eukprot:gene8471-945_t